MSQRTFYTICLLALIIPLNEMHHTFRDVSYNVNPWPFRDYPIDIQWYVKFLCAAIADVLKAVVIFRAARMFPPLRVAAAVYLAISVFDLVMFFLCFNQADYLPFYASIGLLVLFAAFFKRKFTRSKQQHT